jgi:hypothetical protein
MCPRIQALSSSSVVASEFRSGSRPRAAARLRKRPSSTGSVMAANCDVQ